ncbi:RNA polymerase sigma factor [Nocardioides kongjuensis]|uniref:RNA polymerase sigma-70 factor (ECF subfamily) n=1 Tax=Nocardioides kongjuensis TaxID=349522 RepID=A0A852R8C9_9ACTN|nr:sigma-70 family RNA polymerase sigma factor [Nocardioides kongjuensis]NYD29851.1 RNA polymerase sigma-70 factor (ECF subfamily) [Nocardioides kongjuensis]
MQPGTGGFAEVYAEHVTPVWRYVRLRVPADADAEDVTSQVFERAMRSWDGYDGARGGVGAWLMGIARHTVADWWRRNGRELPTDPAAPAFAGGTAEDDPEGDALRRLGADDLRRRLGHLTAREREAVALRFGSDLSSTEIAALLGVTPSGARMLVHRAIGRLREVMDDA